MTARVRTLSDEDLVRLLELLGGADSVELKTRTALDYFSRARVGR